MAVNLNVANGNCDSLEVETDVIMGQGSLFKEGKDVDGVENVETVVVETEYGIDLPIIKLKKKKKFVVATSDVSAILEPFAAERQIKKWARKLKFDNFMTNYQQEGKIWVFWQKDLLPIWANATVERIRNSLEVGHPVGGWGDFNVIRYNHEKVGGLLKPQRVDDDFNSSIMNCGFMEIQEEGSRFSWCNGQEGRGRIWAKLDRVIVNQEFIRRYPATKKCGCKELGEPTKFDGLLNLAAKLKRLKHTPKEWNRNSFGNIFQNITRGEDRIILLEGKVIQSGDAEDDKLLQEAKKGLHDWLYQEEIFMAQKAKSKWIKETDANTRFFHGMARNHRQKEWIGQMEMQDGQVLQSPVEVHDGAVEFFQRS
ncbi:hypothetical protein F2P56_001827 [Juglans regia]|nr:hypothetical protein F2P56_001827 [Juglans regia]